jgi:hypothetical protein
MLYLSVSVSLSLACAVVVYWCCCIFVSLSLTRAGKREGIDVGLSDGTADVIANGQVVASWTGTVVNPATHGSAFYISVSPGYFFLFFYCFLFVCLFVF